MRRFLPIMIISVTLCLLPSQSISGDHDKNLSQWLDLLKKGNAQEKQLALRSLWFLQYEEYRKDPKVLDPIFTALKDKDPIVREAAAAYWTRMTGPLGVSMFKADISSHLVPLLQDEVPAVRSEAAKAANGTRIYATQQLVDALVKSLYDKDLWVRLNSVHALGEIGRRYWSVTRTKKTERMMPTSGAMVQKKELDAPPPDFSPSGRRRRKADTREIVPHPSIDDYKTETTRELLARSPRLNVNGAIAPMIELLDRNDDWRGVFVQQEVVYAFSKMRVQDERAIAALLSKYEQAYLKKPIIQALGICEALQAEKALLKSLEETNEGIRNDALEALLQLPIKWEERKRESIIQDCKDKLNNPYPEVRTYAVRVLGKWDRKAGEKFILQAIKDKSDKVAQAAIEELGNMDSDKFLGDILPYFGHGSKTLRDAA